MVYFYLTLLSSAIQRAWKALKIPRKIAFKFFFLIFCNQTHSRIFDWKCCVFGFPPKMKKRISKIYPYYLILDNNAHLIMKYYLYIMLSFLVIRIFLIISRFSSQKNDGFTLNSFFLVICPTNFAARSMRYQLKLTLPLIRNWFCWYFWRKIQIFLPNFIK